MLMGDIRADMVNDDLPYNIGSHTTRAWRQGQVWRHHERQQSDGEYRNFVKTVMQNTLSVTKPDAHVLFWCDERWCSSFKNCTANSTLIQSGCAFG